MVNNLYPCLLILNAEMYHKEAELDKAQRKLVDTRDDLYEETQGSFYLQI